MTPLRVLLPLLLGGLCATVALAQPDRGGRVGNVAAKVMPLPRLVVEPAWPADPAALAFNAQLGPIQPVVETPAEPVAGPSAVVVLAPVVVTTHRPPDLSTPRENRVEEFFRTGTLAERIGRKVTTRLWMRGDQGVMLSLSW